MRIFPFHKKTKEIAKIVLAVVVIGAALAMSYYTGFREGTQQPKHITVEGVQSPDKNNAVDFTTFWEAWSILKSKYVDKSVVDNNQKLLWGSISGLVSSLDDPHSTYFPPEDAEKFNQDISGEFGGIGAEIGMNKENQIVVVAPMDDTPASRAGLKPGDNILGIDGTSTAGMSVDDAVKQIRGERGATVTLTISRDGATKDVSIVRDVIQVPTLDFKILNREGQVDPTGDIAYIKIYNFYQTAPLLFYQAALKATFSESKALIIDLRNNPGGYLDAAVHIAGWFVKEGNVVVSEQFQDESLNQIFTSKGPSVFEHTPTMVLVNKGSASASEILAGALKESNGATLVGETTFGKGTVQELLPLSDGSMVKVTVAHWITPEGHIIDKNGIEPDVEVKTDENTDPTNDVVLKKAIELLKEKLNS